MGNDERDLDAEIREFALQVERAIAKNEAVLDQLDDPDPNPRMANQAEQYLNGVVE